MDLFFYTGIDNTPLRKIKEHLVSKVVVITDGPTIPTPVPEITVSDIIIIIIQFIIMFVAGSLSWNCSGLYSYPVRVVFAILSALFGFSYIIYYLIFRHDLCKKFLLDKK